MKFKPCVLNISHHFTFLRRTRLMWFKFCWRLISKVLCEVTWEEEEGCQGVKGRGAVTGTPLPRWIPLMLGSCPKNQRQLEC